MLCTGTYYIAYGATKLEPSLRAKNKALLPRRCARYPRCKVLNHVVRQKYVACASSSPHEHAEIMFGFGFVRLQIVSEDYVHMQENFIRFMETNSEFTRHHLYLLCMDDKHVNFFSTFMGFRCIPVKSLSLRDPGDLWILRGHVLSCLVRGSLRLLWGLLQLEAAYFFEQVPGLASDEWSVLAHGLSTSIWGSLEIVSLDFVKLFVALAITVLYAARRYAIRRMYVSLQLCTSRGHTRRLPTEVSFLLLFFPHLRQTDPMCAYFRTFSHPYCPLISTRPVQLVSARKPVLNLR